MRSTAARSRLRNDNASHRRPPRGRQILARTGDRIGCATPLGLGKPVPLLNRSTRERIRGAASF
jgi:hypothetical protein